MALCLTRREKQIIRIGNSIIVKVAEIRGSHVKLHIEAPKEITILRGELEQRAA